MLIIVILNSLSDSSKIWFIRSLILLVCDSDYVDFSSLYVLYFLDDIWTLYMGQ